MAWELFDYDPLTLTTEYFVDNGDDTYTIVTEQDVGPLMEANYQEKMHRRPGERWGGGQIHSRIPNIVLYDLKKRGIIGPNWEVDTPEMDRWINSSENHWNCRWGRA